MATEKATKNKVKRFHYESIKTFEDACKRMDVDPDDLPVMPKRCNAATKKATISGYKLMIITEAINNDNKFPDFTDRESGRYYPWPYVLSSGFGFSHSNYYYDFTYTVVGSRLCFNKSEKAVYCLKQFEDIWKEWLLGV